MAGDELRLATAAGAAVLALSSTGDAVLLVALLGVASGTLANAAVAALAVFAFAARWGAASLDAFAGAQAVLGAGAVVGSAAAVASSWLAAAALVLGSPSGWAGPVFGLVAALGLAGPTGDTPGRLVLRLGGAVAGAGLAWAVGRRQTRQRPRQLVALALAAAAAGLAVVG